MSSLADLIRAAQSRAQQVREQVQPALGNPESFQLSGTSYTAAIAISGVRPDLTADGSRREQTIKIIVRKSVLPTQPAQDAVITAAGHDFRIDPNQEQKDSGDHWVIRARRHV